MTELTRTSPEQRKDVEKRHNDECQSPMATARRGQFPLGYYTNAHADRGYLLGELKAAEDKLATAQATINILEIAVDDGQRLVKNAQGNEDWVRRVRDKWFHYFEVPLATRLGLERPLLFGKVEDVDLFHERVINKFETAEAALKAKDAELNTIRRTALNDAYDAVESCKMDGGEYSFGDAITMALDKITDVPADLPSPAQPSGDV